MIQHVNVNSIRIAVDTITVSDKKTPIILLHDSLGCISVWKDFPQKLAAETNRTCVVYDRQGYGGSDAFSTTFRDSYYLEQQADFLILFLDALKISNCILFGHSDGGSIALIAAAKYPQRVVAVITEGAHVFVEEITLQGIREAVELYQTTDLKQRLEKHHSDKTDALFRAWTETWLSPEFRNWNIEHFLPKIACPVLIMQGENDEYGSLRQVDSICSQVTGSAEKLIIPAIGHTPHKEATVVTLNHTAYFLQQINQ